ncbi:DUF4282 domain-containing protein [Actinomadura barringtoniae]|uniref:DUF4282 domain-containing protein n=1 Tax=Actinomadura barringtoniae TaxID=1427535 RepID=A0A939P747_9ACTN|nr:DUF4282 domain-containing protein [Actinomadura barringtoniae]MBO2446861.1 DUF4282 domain-containing protein [Actinomadura barringtoniae]
MRQPPGPQGGWEPSRREAPPTKGLVASLFDTNFDHMVTVSLIKIVYRIQLVLITLFAIVMGWYGLAFLEWNTTLGVMTLIATPLVWIALVLGVRMTLEFLINQFKISEYLRIMKDKS